MPITIKRVIILCNSLTKLGGILDKKVDFREEVWRGIGVQGFGGRGAGGNVRCAAAAPCSPEAALPQ